MISTMPGQPGSSVPTFVLIPASMDRQINGNHVDVERNQTPEVKNDLATSGGLIISNDSDQVLASADEDSILYRSMAIADNQTHY